MRAYLLAMVAPWVESPSLPRSCDEPWVTCAVTNVTHKPAGKKRDEHGLRFLDGLFDRASARRSLIETARGGADRILRARISRADFRVCPHHADLARPAWAPPRALARSATGRFTADAPASTGHPHRRG